MVAILSTFRELDRLRQIYVVLAKHGFGELARRIGLGGKKKDVPRLGEGSANGTEGGEAEEDVVEEPEAIKSSPLAERVRLVAMELGPSFVKLGQIASTRADVLPADWVRELKKLHDEVTPLAFEDIKSAVESPLGAPLDRFFESFEESRWRPRRTGRSTARCCAPTRARSMSSSRCSDRARAKRSHATSSCSTAWHA